MQRLIINWCLNAIWTVYINGLGVSDRARFLSQGIPSITITKLWEDEVVACFT